MGKQDHLFSQGTEQLFCCTSIEWEPNKWASTNTQLSSSDRCKYVTSTSWKLPNIKCKQDTTKGQRKYFFFVHNREKALILTGGLYLNKIQMKNWVWNLSSRVLVRYYHWLSNKANSKENFFRFSFLLSFFKGWFHWLGKSWMVRDFIVFPPSQSLKTY